MPDRDTLSHVSTDIMVGDIRDVRLNLTHWHRVQVARMQRDLKAGVVVSRPNPNPQEVTR